MRPRLLAASAAACALLTGGDHGLRAASHGSGRFGVHLGGWTANADLLFAPLLTVPLAPEAAGLAARILDRADGLVGTRYRDGGDAPETDFFGNDGSHVNHVAIYVGRDRVIHASARAGAVRYDVLGEGDRGTWFADHLVTARRLLGER